MNEPYPPEFVPGDLVEVVGAEYPHGSGNVRRSVGLYQNIGQPGPPDHRHATEHDKVLNEQLVSTPANGTHLIVVATCFCNTDKMWYYLLRGMGYNKCFGWTRSASRLKKVIT
jgi:hypothetical protein